MNYIILEKTSAVELAKLVNDFLKQGWMCVGPAMPWQSCIIQTMVDDRSKIV